MINGIILDNEKITNTYQTKIPCNQLNKLKLRKWIPVKESSKFAETTAYVIGKVMGDGHLDKCFTTSFIDNSKNNLKKLKIFLLNKYSLDKKHCIIKERRVLGYSSILRINDCLFGRMLSCLGAPRGNKTKQSFLIPKWILSSERNSRSFLKGLLEDELTTIKIEKSNHSVTPKLKMSKEESLIGNLELFLKQVKGLLEKFDVKSSEVSRGKTYGSQKTKDLFINIKRNKGNILNFSKNVGFGLNTKKIKSLRKCMGVLQKTRYNRKPFIDKQRIIRLKKEGLSLREISHILNLNKTSVHRVLLKNKGLCGSEDLNFP